MQKYKENTNYKNIRTISGYSWLILVINQDEVGARLGLSKNYVKHIPMFREYLELRGKGYKVTYIHNYLGGKFGIHPSSVKRVVSMMLQTVEL